MLVGSYGWRPSLTRYDPKVCEDSVPVSSRHPSLTPGKGGMPVVSYVEDVLTREPAALKGCWKESL